MTSARRAVGLAALVLVTIGGCTPKERPLVVWHSYRGAEEVALLEAVDAYRKTSPIPVEVLGVPNETLASKLTSAIPRNNGPDLFVFAHERVGGWVHAGLVAEALPADPADFLPQTRAALSFEGKLWGYPLAFKSLALFINDDLMPATPTSTDAFFAPAGTYGKGVFPIGYPAGSFYFHAPWFFAAGGGLRRDDGGVPAQLLTPGKSFDFKSPAMLESFDFVGRLAREGHLPSEPAGSTITALFNEGRLAAALSGPWFVGEISKEIRWSVHPLPPYRDPKTGDLRPATPFLTVEGAFVSAKARHPAAAHGLAAYLAGPESAPTRATKGRQAVAHAGTWRQTEIAQDAILGAFLAQLPNTVPMDNDPAMQLVWEPGDLALKQLLRGSSPAEAAEAATRRYDAIANPSGEEGPPSPAAPLPWIILLGAATILALVAAARIFRKSRAHPIDRGPAPARAFAWVAPAVIATGILVMVPFIVGLVLAFFHHAEGEWTFVGGNNFADILGSNHFDVFEPLSFYYALLVTVLWTAVNIVLHVGIGFALALLLNRPLLALKPVYRVLLILPWAVPSYITALMWKGLFNTQFGAINGILESVGLSGVPWFDSFGTAFFANVCANAWLGFPFMMVISLGALQAIPKDLLEAASVDGASAWQRFRHITVPLVKPALVPAILLGVVWTFNQFNIIYLVSGGAPDNSTDILISEAYRWAFARREQYGYAAAYAALIFIILLFWARYSMRVSRRLETSTDSGKRAGAAA